MMKAARIKSPAAREKMGGMSPLVIGSAERIQQTNTDVSLDEVSNLLFIIGSTAPNQLSNSDRSAQEKTETDVAYAPCASYHGTVVGGGLQPRHKGSPITTSW